MSKSLHTEAVEQLFDAILTLETKEECYSFLLGAVLCDEVKAVLRAGQQRIVLGGQKQLREAMGILLRAKCQKTVTVLDDAAVAGSTAIGAVRIYEMT